MSTFSERLFFAWELNHHNRCLSNHALLKVMLTAVVEDGLAGDFRDRFSRRVIDSALLPPNNRADSGRSDLLRDYQQLLKEWGFVWASDEGFRVSPLGEMLLQGSPEAAIQFAVLRFQYPNGYKQRFPASWPWLCTEPERPNQNWAEYLASAGVRVRPAVIVARLLLAGSVRGLVHELTAVDIRDRLFRIISEPNSDDDLLSQYLAPPDLGYTAGSTPAIRNANEWIRAIAATGLFEMSMNGRLVRLRLIDARRSALESLLQEIMSEPLWVPTASAGPFEQSWFSHSQAPNRGSAEPENSGSQFRSAAGTTSSVITLRPHGRVRVISAPATPPIGYDSAAAQLRQRSSELVHEVVVNALAQSLRKQGLEPMSDPNSVDLLVRHANSVRIYEVKSIEGSDWSNRLRLAVGQILEYQSRYLVQEGSLPDTTIVLSRVIVIPAHLKSHLCRLGISILAFDGDGFVELSV